MPWVALPFAAREKKVILSNKYGIQGIPSLVILDQNFNTITTNGRRQVVAEPENFPWLPTPFSDDLGAFVLNKAGDEVPTSSLQKFVGLYFSAHWYIYVNNLFSMRLN